VRDNTTVSDGAFAVDGNPDGSQLLRWNRDVAMLGISERREETILWEKEWDATSNMGRVD